MVSARPPMRGAADLRETVRRNSDSGPDWLSLERIQAADLSGFPEAPAKQLESWRKIDLSGLDLSAPELLTVPNPPAETRVNCPQTVLHTSSAADADGVVRDEVTKLVRGRLASQRGHVFERVAVALCGHSTILKADRPVPEPVTVVRSPNAGGNAAATYGHLAILVERGAELTVVEELQGEPGDAIQLWCTATDIHVAPGGLVNYVLLRRLHNREFAFHDVRITLERDARAHVSMVHSGGLVGKTLINGILAAPGAQFRGVGIGTGKDREFHDVEMMAEHLAEHTQSSLLYKTVLGDRAHSIFNGNLHIAPGLRHTQSRQINNNILLSRRARAESMPNLVVRAEDVSAEHGATVGQLDREALFFLMSRGLPELAARHLLIQGFIEEIVSEIPLASRRDDILLALRKNLSF